MIVDTEIKNKSTAKLDSSELAQITAKNWTYS